MRKRKKQINVQIQNRDVDIMKCIGYGGRRVGEILERLRVRYGYTTLNLPELRQRLFLLASAEYIAGRIYSERIDSDKYRRYAMYALTQDGAAELSDSGVSPRIIRTGLPKQKIAKHAHTVVSVLLTLNDMVYISDLNWEYKDEELLRREAASQPFSDIEVYPDLWVKIDFEKNENWQFYNIEIDRSTINSERVAQKLEKLATEYYYSLVLCSDRERIKSIITAVKKYTYILGSQKRLLFALTSDFREQGLKFATYYGLDGEKKSLMLLKRIKKNRLES